MAQNCLELLVKRGDMRDCGFARCFAEALIDHRGCDLAVLLYRPLQGDLQARLRHEEARARRDLSVACT